MTHMVSAHHIHCRHIWIKPVSYFNISPAVPLVLGGLTCQSTTHAMHHFVYTHAPLPRKTSVVLQHHTRCSSRTRQVNMSKHNTRHAPLCIFFSEKKNPRGDPWKYFFHFSFRQIPSEKNSEKISKFFFMILPKIQGGTLGFFYFTTWEINIQGGTLGFFFFCKFFFCKSEMIRSIKGSPSKHTTHFSLQIEALFLGFCTKYATIAHILAFFAKVLQQFVVKRQKSAKTSKTHSILSSNRKVDCKFHQNVSPNMTKYNRQVTQCSWQAYVSSKHELLVWH